MILKFIQICIQKLNTSNNFVYYYFNFSSLQFPLNPVCNPSQNPSHNQNLWQPKMSKVLGNGSRATTIQRDKWINYANVNRILQMSPHLPPSSKHVTWKSGARKVWQMIVKAAAAFYSRRRQLGWKLKLIFPPPPPPEGEVTGLFLFVFAGF